jgi:hypothetical protein
MIKQITILLLFLFTNPFAWSQDKYIKTTTPCNNELLKKTPGRWMPIGRFTWDKISKLEELEILKRLESIQKMAFAVYPEPMAFDAVQGYALHKKDFASQLKLEKTAYMISRTDINGFPTIFYDYFVKFCQYICGRDSYEIIRGAGCETGTNLVVTINTLSPLLRPLLLDDVSAEIMRIDGRPLQVMPYFQGKWQGYDFYNLEGVDDPKSVLLHRANQLPYIPVTRKQYLDRCIEALQINLNKDIIPFEKREGLALLMKKEEWDAQIKKLEKYRDDILKYYRDELEATTRAGLLDAPVILASGFMNLLISEPVFSKNPVGGQMLITENPTYFKKDLPKYIPQIIICTIEYSKGWLPPEVNPYRLYEQDFLIEKLQAMIDK